nr:hypothetical protein [Amnibacterium kyonggiense]
MAQPRRPTHDRPPRPRRPLRRHQRRKPARRAPPLPATTSGPISTRPLRRLTLTAASRIGSRADCRRSLFQVAGQDNTGVRGAALPGAKVRGAPARGRSRAERRGDAVRLLQITSASSRTAPGSPQPASPRAWISPSASPPPCGEEIARFTVLGAEHAPEPPFDTGTPEKAGTCPATSSPPRRRATSPTPDIPPAALTTKLRLRSSLPTHQRHCRDGREISTAHIQWVGPCRREDCLQRRGRRVKPKERSALERRAL